MSECLRESLITTCESSEPCEPTEGAFHHSPSEQRNKTVLSFMVFNDLQFDLRIASLLRRRLARIALINKRNFPCSARHFLYSLRQFCNLATFLFISCGHGQSLSSGSVSASDIHSTA